MERDIVPFTGNGKGGHTRGNEGHGHLAEPPAVEVPGDGSGFLEVVAEELARRDERIAELERALAGREAPSHAPSPREVGDAVAAILEASEAAAAQTRSHAQSAADETCRRVEGVLEQVAGMRGALDSLTAEVSQRLEALRAEGHTVDAGRLLGELG